MTVKELREQLDKFPMWTHVTVALDDNEHYVGPSVSSVVYEDPDPVDGPPMEGGEPIELIVLHVWKPVVSEDGIARHP